MIDQRIIDALQAAGIDYNKSIYDPAKSFRNNGIDSLDVMSLLLSLEEAYEIRFTEEEVTLIDTPAEISALLDNKLA